VTVIIGPLQYLHLENTGKEVSRSEAINALVAAGLPLLLGADGVFSNPKKPEMAYVRKNQK
jgi:hypothetical protein